ncbi:MAG: glycosyltransferase [Pyrinomonadaceae bacterium]
MIRNRDIIFISSIDWDDNWQAPQELASRLSRAGNRVLYLENTGVRAPALRDTRRILRRLKHWAGELRTRGMRQVLPDLWVHAPLVLPPFNAGLRDYLNRHLFLRLISGASRRIGMRDPIIWAFLPTNTSVELIELLSSAGSKVIYYCAADFSQLTTSHAQLRRSEAQLLKRADVVFTICGELADHCRRWNNNVHLAPYGVNLNAFPVSTEDSSTPLRAQPEGNWMTHSRTNGHRVVGYVGGLHRHVDVDMLVAMARARPGWSWVFVGSPEGHLKGLEQLPNVYLLGQREHHELAEYIREFDVCIVPYLRSAYTETVVPSKINEYLAMGKPVAATNLPPVREFNDKHDILVTTEADPGSFLCAIERALKLGENPVLNAQRRAVACRSDWEARLESMSELILTERDSNSEIHSSQISANAVPSDDGFIHRQIDSRS